MTSKDLSFRNRLGRFFSQQEYLWHHRIQRQELKSFRDLHQGKKALIVGNGPTVKTADLEGFTDFVTFACNRFHLCYAGTDFRPNYTVVVDAEMVSEFGDEILDACESTAFVGDPDLSLRHTHARFLPLSSNPDFHFSNKKIHEFLHPGSSVVVTALQIASYMGVSEIFLYGVDHSFIIKPEDIDPSGKVIGEGNHFIPDYRSGKAWFPPKTEKIEEAFGVCVQRLTDQGVALINLTPNSQLPHVERGNLQRFISSNYEEW